MQQGPLAKVSVVVAAHKEGLLLNATMKSIARSVTNARRNGIDVEVLLGLDRADMVTKAAAHLWKGDGVSIFEVDYGDPGTTRNYLIERSTSDFIAILDGDDLFCSWWLTAAAKAALADRRPIVWHPEVNVMFGELKYAFYHTDMEDPKFDLLSVMVCNPWTSLCFSRRDLFMMLPYSRCDFADGVGHEDWTWNRKAIELGYTHKVVIGTGHGIRRKEISQVRQAAASRSLPWSTDIGRKILDRRAQVDRNRQEIEFKSFDLR